MKLIFAILFLYLSTAFSQDSSGSQSKPTFRMNGKANLTSNYVEKGLPQTAGDPGLQADFWFNFGSQFRMGLWAANVNYENNAGTHFWLKLNADIRVDFTNTSNLIIKYSDNHYFKSNNRDGNTIGVHLDFSGYKVLYEIDNNWQGTRAAATYAGLGKDFPIWTNWIWANQFGYTIPEADGVKAFFDIRSGLGKKLKDIFTMATLTYTNATGSFKEQGELAAFVNVSVEY